MELREKIDFPNGFMGNVIPREFYYIKGINGSDREILTMIKNLQRVNGCNASNEYLANILGVSQRQIINSINKLLDLKLITKTLKNNNDRRLFLSTSLYSPLQIKVMEIENEDEKEGVKKTSQGSEENFTGGVKKTSPNNKDIYNNNNNIIISKEEIEKVINEWNSLNTFGISKVRAITNARLKHLKARVEEYSLKEVLESIGIIKHSSFLTGRTEKQWFITFDWFINPSNFIKVLEGNYTDKGFVKCKPKEEATPKVDVNAILEKRRKQMLEE